MEVTFWGVRGLTPSPGPSTVRYGGNTSCVSVRLGDGRLVILDCGTGARNLGLALMAAGFGEGRGEATLLLSHTHWDHIQGFPFFNPFYVPGNRITIYGGATSPARLEELLEGQMSAQYFPVQTLRNLGAKIEMRALEPGGVVQIPGATVRAEATPHAETPVIAFRVDDGKRALAYVSDAGYGPEGPDGRVLALCADVDLLIHDSTYFPEHRAARLDRGLASVDQAVDCALASRARRLALFHYDQDYSDHDVDELVRAGQRRALERGGNALEVFGSAEGLTLSF
jgi:phosphoribosyl 1,2-cyclic phosphodiesterase